MANILDLFNQREVLNYLKTREFPALLGEQLFPEIKKQSLEFDQIKGANNATPVIASIHAFDTEAEIGSREAHTQTLGLAFIKRKIQLKEKDLIALRNPRTPAEQEYLMKQVYNDMEVLIAGVKARVEAMRMEALASGIVTLDENNLDAVVNYGIPDEQKEALAGANMWTDANSDPIDDLQRWSDSLISAPTRALTSRAVLSALLRHPKIISALFGRDSGRVASVSDLNNFLTQHQLPTIATYDRKYKKQIRDGTYQTHRYFPANKFVMFGSDTLGETVYGPTPEESRIIQDPSVDITTVGNVLGMVYEENLDPVGTWTKAVATALPSFPAADEVFQAQPIA
ncbi:major capsid protein [Listeria booriae]|uniref:Major capsid protein n=1 Tax=Listeria booriae TaxID=1552123 RepID=A0A7X1CY44_9LIST|nr:major capsid protein [Listeria booriae]MBC1290626.1 major capsid protein [Listeria booriae]MBC2115690.1 major capsid protein [Listeria booriae]